MFRHRPDSMIHTFADRELDYTKFYCVPLTSLRIAKRDTDAQIEVTSVNLFGHISVPITV